MIGIYKITNKLNGKCYIGQSLDIEQRWSKHLSTFKRKNCPNYKIYRAFAKYGLENFTFEILEECMPEELDHQEVYWINFFNSFEDGYNMSLGGKACNGTNDKKVYQYSLSGHLIKEYKSAHEAARQNNIQFTNICKVCRGERKTAGGFGWSYEKHEQIQPIKTKRLGDGTVLQFTKDGQFVAEYSTATEACRVTGINNRTIGSVCKGKGKTAGGFVWKYKNDQNLD